MKTEELQEKEKKDFIDSHSQRAGKGCVWMEYDGIIEMNCPNCSLDLFYSIEPSLLIYS